MYLLVLLPVVYFIGMCLIKFASSILLKKMWHIIDCNYNKRKKKTKIDCPKLLEREPLLFNSSRSYDGVTSTDLGGGGATPGKIKKNVTVIEVTH